MYKTNRAIVKDNPVLETLTSDTTNCLCYCATKRAVILILPVAIDPTILLKSRHLRQLNY